MADACKLVNQTMDTDQMANAGGTKAVNECHRLGGDPQSGQGDTAVWEIQHASIDIKVICVFFFN